MKIDMAELWKVLNELKKEGRQCVAESNRLEQEAHTLDSEGGQHYADGDDLIAQSRNLDRASRDAAIQMYQDGDTMRNIGISMQRAAENAGERATHLRDVAHQMQLDADMVWGQAVACAYGADAAITDLSDTSCEVCGDRYES